VLLTVSFGSQLATMVVCMSMGGLVQNAQASSARHQHDMVGLASSVCTL
jgi:hypothetical protein